MERFEANSEFFPNGLKDAVSNIRAKNPYLENVAVWHALMGYWGGIAPGSELTEKYKATKALAYLIDSNYKPQEMTAIHPSDIARWYDDFYAWLSFSEQYQAAWTAAHLRHFQGKAISCMSMTPQILFHQFLPTNAPKLMLRNSDDFYPEHPSSHALHVFVNAHNSCTDFKTGWALPAEIGSTRLRQKTVCLARNVSNITAVVGSVFQTYMMNPTAWNFKGYTGFVWGTCALLVGIWAFFRLPETKDRTFHELDLFFAHKISARKFRTTNIDEFDEHEQNVLAERISISGPSGDRAARLPSVSGFLAKHGHDEATAAQRRGSIIDDEHEVRRPSISEATTNYLKTH